MPRKVVVETVLTAKDENTKRTWDEARGAAERYENTAARAGGKAGMMAMGAGAIAVGALAAMTYEAGKAMVHLGSQAEKTNIQLAGDIQVYKYAANYNDALLLSSKYLQQIRRDAAALPGEDSQFIQSFGIAFPAMAEKGVRNMEQMVGLSNKLTAVLISKGVDPGQIGRDISLMVGGHAGADVRSFTLMKGVLGAKGGAATTEEWNKLKVEDRFKRLEAAAGRFDDTIKEFGKSWEAVSSTSISYVKALAREAGGPMFEAVKTSLDFVNKFYEAHEEQIIGMAQFAGVAGMDSARAAGRGAMAIGSALEPRGYAGAGMAGERGTRMFDDLVGAGSAVVDILVPLGDAMSSVGSAIAGGMGGLLPGLTSIGEIVVVVGGELIKGFLSIVTILADTIGPKLTEFATGISDLIKLTENLIIIGIGKIKPLWDEFAKGATRDYEKASQTLTDVNEWLGKKTGIHGLGSALEGGAAAPGIMAEVHKVAQEEADKARKELGIGRTGAASGLQAYYEKWQKGKEDKDFADWLEEEKAGMRARKLKRDKPVQDFRGSKFSIEQKFAPGFDPGRVLTAIKEDVGALAQKRLSSGISPLFGNY